MDPSREEAELRSYLGPRYDHSRLVRYQQQLDDEYQAMDDEQAFYRSSEAYLSRRSRWPGPSSPTCVT